MARGWVDRARISRRLSRAGLDDFFSEEILDLSDYAKKIKQFHELVSIDRRAVAVGSDIEAHWHEAMISVNDELAHVVWQNISQIKMWYDLLISDGTVENPKKVLTYMQFPWSFMMDYMSDRTKEFTFINNIDLYYFESFYLDAQKLAEYPDIRYSAVDLIDIVSGETSYAYDVVRATGFGINRPSIDVLESLMNSVKIGGVFVLSDASDYGMLYMTADSEITSEFLDYGKYIASRGDFISYHLPYDVGLTVAKRVS
jgi:hypothetical protein